MARSRSDLFRLSTGVAPRPETVADQTLRLTLTIVGHPDVDRVGEVHRVEPGEIGISRVSPDFAKPGSDDSYPLADASISRKPTVLSFNAQQAPVVRVSDGSTVTVIAYEPAAGALLKVADGILLHARVAAEAASPGQRIATFVGESPGALQLHHTVAQAAANSGHVLVRGETGTGKELVARALLELGPNPSGPFVAVNVATIRGDLATSELFGHSKGAFTGAEHCQAGLFQQADGGTLFLDEIGEASLELQAMLLRTIETSVVRRVGDGTESQVDVRVVTATDADLEALVEQGGFRPALFHRLAGHTISIPPLRERPEDIPRLVLGAIANGEGPSVPSWAWEKLCRYDWPGNVRQLLNLTRSLPSDANEDVWRQRLTALPGQQTEPAPGPTGKPSARRKPETVGEAELVEALKHNEWKALPAARSLGISRPSLYMLLDRFPRVKAARSLPAEVSESAETTEQLAKTHGVDVEVIVLRRP